MAIDSTGRSPVIRATLEIQAGDYPP